VTEPPLTRALAELTVGDESSFGGKSAHLGELLHAGGQVPPGFALSTECYDAFVDQNGLGEIIEGALASADADDIDALTAASDEIGKAMRSRPVPAAVHDEVELRYQELRARTCLDEPATAVRSSSIGEDSLEATFAGQQETSLWVSGVGDICVAVRNCWASLYSARAISYRARLARDGMHPAMGVTVQLMVDAAVSGVLFTCNPVSGDPSMVAVNASWGLGLAVVAGEVTPDDYLVSKITGEVVRAQIGSKDVEYVSAGARGTIREDVPPERRETPCLDDGDLAALVDVARRVERHFGRHQDVEWAIARGATAPDGLFVLQSRPVTTLRRQRSKPAPLSAMALLMGTFGAAAGEPGEQG
jgi:phosphoenolpyruvate synthase/pyruvate phosphate dikinase